MVNGSEGRKKRSKKFPLFAALARFTTLVFVSFEILFRNLFFLSALLNYPHRDLPAFVRASLLKPLATLENEFSRSLLPGSKKPTRSKERRAGEVSKHTIRILAILSRRRKSDTRCVGQIYKHLFL